MTASTVLTAAGPWAVAVVGLGVVFLGFVVMVVRTAKTDMWVRIGKIIEIRRGRADPPSAEAKRPRQLRSAARPEPDDEPSARAE